MASFAEPLLTAATTPELSHSKRTFLPESAGRQTAQLRRRGTSSLAVIPAGDQLGGHCNCSHFLSNSAP